MLFGVCNIIISHVIVPRGKKLTDGMRSQQIEILNVDNVMGPFSLLAAAIFC